MKNHTPRTQDVINHIADNPDNLQPIFDHARRLEIELNAAKEQLRIEAGDDYSSIKELQRELAAAKLDCGHAEKRCDAAIASWDEERGRALREGARVVEWKARAELAEAELAAERARHAGLVPLLARWLKMADDCHREQQEIGQSEYNVTAGLLCDTRDAIDAAMKEDAK